MNPPPAPMTAPSGASTWFDVVSGSLAVILVCGLVFFHRQRDFDYIETEGLRAIVAREMTERGGPSMPTVHHRPYVNKPPLAAWTTCLLSRALARFDEQVARLPAAISATLLVLVIMWCAARWMGLSAGLTAAAFTLSNIVVLDYGFRAELDMPFTFFVTVMFLLLWPALTRTGAASLAAWLGVYAAATLGAMWKAPHSLIFLWLGLLTWGKVKRSWRWLWAPGHLLGLAGSLGVLVAWLMAVTRFAGGGRVGRAAGSEVVNRLAPSLRDILEIPLFPLILFLTALPASAFLVAGMIDAVRRTSNPAPSKAGGLRARCSEWWQAVTLDPFTEFLLLMLIPGLVFLCLAPAKSGRYSLPLFPLLFLLAARFTWHSRPAFREIPLGLRPVLCRVWRVTFAVIGIMGLVCMMAAVVLTFKPDISIGPLLKLGPSRVWWTAGVGGLFVAWLIVRAVPAHRTATFLGPALLLAVVTMQPLAPTVWWPVRVRSDSQRDAALLINAVVPEGEPVFVLGRQEFPDTALYSERRFIWIDEPSDAAAHTTMPRPFFLMRENELAGDRKGDPDYRKAPGYKTVATFTRIGRNVVVFQMDVHGTSGATPEHGPPSGS